jgi:outer membrane protein assembly factor BamB
MAGNSPVVYDGRVIGATGDHLIYCLDAATGRELWRTPGPRHPERMKLLAQSLAEKKSAGYGGNRNMMNNPTYADGVFIMPADCIADANGELIVRTPDRKRVRGSGIWGFDAATGKVLWRRNERIMGGMFTPVVWANQGRQFVIIGNGFHDDGVPTLLRCLDPKTGKDLWTLPSGSNGFAPALFDDVLVLNVGDDKSATGQVGAIRLTPTGPQKLWELPAPYGYVTARNGVARIGDRIVLVLAERTVVVELATGKVVSEAADKKFTGSLLMSFNDRILCQPDTVHNATLLRMFGLRDGQLTVLGGDWDPPHLPSGSYEVPWIHPLLDGRIIIRGAESIYCYDLRATPK